MTENSGNDNQDYTKQGQPADGQPSGQGASPLPAGSPQASPAGSGPGGMRKTQPGEARTALDLDACREVAAKKVAEKEQQIQDKSFQSAPAADTVKPFQAIEDFKPASPCSSLWEQMEGTARVRFCKRCQHQVYDFSAVELPEAEDIIFKKEAKKGVTLYKRIDGRFHTVDCPVGAKSAQTRLLAIVGGALLVVALIAVAVMTPHPEPAPTTTVGEPAARQKKPAASSAATVGKTNANPQVGRPASRTVRVYMEDGSPATLPSPLLQNTYPAVPPTLAPTPAQTNQSSPAATDNTAPVQPAQPPSTAAPIESPPAATQNPQAESAAPAGDSAPSAQPGTNSPYIWQKQ